ncbi:TPA: N-acetylmuramoyl-L-alanine amidase [Legionella anisa]
MGGPAAPAVRQMDNYGEDVSNAFDDAENEFFSSGKHFKKDDVIDLISKSGFFRVNSYENTSPIDRHYVVFFFNKKNYDMTKNPEVFEVHGTLAQRYIELHRNQPNITDFPIDNDRPLKADSNYVISVESESALVWSNATNKVTQRKYTEYKPVNENTLVAFTEEYTMTDADINFKNWKSSNLQNLSSRGAGRPTQILLHETAGMQMDASAAFNVPAHFVIGNIKDNKGTIFQTVDIAANVPHGEITNSRAIGIEFVNAPFDIWEQVQDPNDPKRSIDKIPRVKSNFGLTTSTQGIYLLVEKINIKDVTINKPVQFIPLEFSDVEENGFFEVKIPEDKLLNKKALLAFKIKGKDIATEKDKIVTIQYCKPAKFEHLKYLVELLYDNDLIKDADFEDGEFWKGVYYDPDQDKTFYIYQKLFTETATTTVNPAGKTIKKIIMHFTISLVEPCIFCHAQIGHHVDGYLQGLYLYLRIYETLSIKATLQYMIFFLTSEKTSAEKTPLEISEETTVTRTSEINSATNAESNIDIQFSTPASPATIKMNNFLEIDIDAAKAKFPEITN